MNKKFTSMKAISRIFQRWHAVQRNDEINEKRTDSVVIHDEWNDFALLSVIPPLEHASLLAPKQDVALTNASQSLTVIAYEADQY